IVAVEHDTTGTFVSPKARTINSDLKPKAAAHRAYAGNVWSWDAENYAGIAAHSTFGDLHRPASCGRRHGGDNLRITPAIHGGASAVEGDGARALCRPETAAVDLHLGAHRPTCGGQVGDDWVGQAEQHVLVAGDAIDCHLH